MFYKNRKKYPEAKHNQFPNKSNTRLLRAEEKIPAGEWGQVKEDHRGDG